MMPNLPIQFHQNPLSCACTSLKLDYLPFECSDVIIGFNMSEDRFIFQDFDTFNSFAQVGVAERVKKKHLRISLTSDRYPDV